MEAESLAAEAKAHPTAPFSSSNIRSWLPAKAQLSMKNRLFSKNILHSQDFLVRATATWKSSFAFAVLVVGTCYLAYLLLLRPSSASNGKPLWQISSMLADDATINRLDTELDSDEYEDEEESSRSSGFLANSKERLALRKMLGRNDHTLNKRSSIVRITSSDPTSSLCENPMQVDLEPHTRRSFWPAPVSANTTPSDPSTPSSPVVPSPTLNAATVQRSSSASPGPAASRRRKESGRLHTASPSRSPLGAGVTRSRSADARSPLARTAARNKRNSASSIASTDAPVGSTGSPRLPQSGLSQAWAHGSSATMPDVAGERDHMPGTPSMESEASSVSAALGHASRLAQYDAASPTSSAYPSPTSSTFSISRAPSILKRRPQTFRTASLRDIDISYSLMQRKESLPMFAGVNPALLHHHHHQQQQQQQHDHLQANGIFLPPGAGSPAPPPYQPSNPDFGSSPTESESAWPQAAKVRSIKLVEPDWRPHIDSHIRARERLETATRFAAFKSTDSLPGAEELNYAEDDVDPDDFWFERFTQSTAAAGRDWDWRKRRARLQRAAALGMALGQSGLAPRPDTNLPGNVGLTDVQLQQQPQQGAAPTSAAQAASPSRKQLPLAAPLITFTEQELKTAPVLKVDTESGRRSLSRSNSEASLSPTAQHGDTPMSPTPSGTGTPLGGIFGGAASVEGINVSAAARAAQRRRASEDAGSSQVAAAQASKRGMVNKITRRRLSASAAASVPSSPGPPSQNSSPNTSPSVEGLSGSPFRQLSPSPLAESSSVFDNSNSYSDLSSDAETGSKPSISSSFSVPGRLSSLSGTVGKRVSLTNLRAGLRRDSGEMEFLQDAGGIELVPSSPELSAEERFGSTYLEDTAQEGPRSSADAYSMRSGEDREAPPSLQRGNAWQPGGEDDARPRKSPSQPPVYRGGALFAKQSSAPLASSSYHADQVEELQNDLERDSERDSISRGSKDSSSSDLLRRKMRARSQTESASLQRDSVVLNSGSLTARKDGLAALSAGVPTSSPPVVKSRARNGSRSSIMRSASGAHLDLDRTARRRSSIRNGSDTSSIGSSTANTTGSRNGSTRYNTSPKRSRKDSSAGSAAAPDPQMQPEPAPRGMAQRARSASLSSTASANSSARSSRSGSFREGMVGLSMTSQAARGG